MAQFVPAIVSGAEHFWLCARFFVSLHPADRRRYYLWERNIFGYVLGFLFRSIRLIGGGITYAIVIVSASVIYLAWAGVLPYILLRIAGHTPAALFYMKNS